MRVIGLSGCRTLLASAILSAGLAFSGQAGATPLPATFNVSGVFDDGGTLSGTFGLDVYGYIDDGTVNLTATAGTTLTSVEIYTIPPDARAIDPNDPLSATGVNFIDINIAPNRMLHLEFGALINQSVAPGTPITNLPLSLVLDQSYECYSWSCPGPTGTGGTTRYLVSGDVTAQAAPFPGQTPIPGALPLFAGGAGLLGFLGLRRRRKS
jgi:hypothetical protein